MMITSLTVYLAVVVLLSLISFVAYGWDKRQSVLGYRRIPEQTLHVLSLLGGWPGALLGQRQFRHKTQKVSFRILFWLTVILHCGIVGTVIARSSPDGPHASFKDK